MAEKIPTLTISLIFFVETIRGRSGAIYTISGSCACLTTGKTFGQSCSLARNRRDEEGFAEVLGVTPHTVLRYESGEISPSPETVERIAQILNFPPAFL